MQTGLNIISSTCGSNYRTINSIQKEGYQTDRKAEPKPVQYETLTCIYTTQLEKDSLWGDLNALEIASEWKKRLDR